MSPQGQSVMSPQGQSVMSPQGQSVMSPQEYPPLEFAHALVVSGDLDPVYLLLADGLADHVYSSLELERLVVLYWLFYDVGTAAHLLRIEREEPGDSPAIVAGLLAGTALRRGAERRHFRGTNAVRAWPTFSDPLRRYVPRDLPPEFDVLLRYYTDWPQFGPWAAFKAADMTERLLRAGVSDSSVTQWFSGPLAGGALMFSVLGGPSWPHGQKSKCEWVCQELDSCEQLRQYCAPGRFDRPLRNQEHETICCKYKAHIAGHYLVGHDIVALGRSLTLAASEGGGIAAGLWECFSARWPGYAV